MYTSIHYFAGALQQQRPNQSGPGPSSRWCDAEQDEDEDSNPQLPDRKTFDPKPLAELLNTEAPQVDPLIKTMGFSDEDIQVLFKASKELSRFSMKNVRKPWLSVHCKQMGKDRVAVILREFVQTIRPKGRKGRWSGGA